MRVVYEPANALEGQMLVSYLAIHDIEAFLQGEHVQSGAGELPVFGLMTVQVRDEDWESAHKILKDWESTQVEATTYQSTPTVKKVFSIWNYFLTLLAGGLVGMATMHYYIESKVSYGDRDYNHDKIPDEKLTYKNGWLVLMEKDRNFDGAVDAKHFFEDSLSTNSLFDDNYDGKFETEYFYRHDEVSFLKSDTNDDGEIDYITDYYLGKPLYIVTLYDLRSHKKRKIQRYEMAKLVSAEWDSDQDGVMDTIIKYDEYEEEVSREKIN